MLVDDDAALQNRVSPDKPFHDTDVSIPFGASATLFITLFTAAGYLVEEVTWAAFNPANLKIIMIF